MIVPDRIDGDRVVVELDVEHRRAITAVLDWALAQQMDVKRVLLLEPAPVGELANRLRRPDDAAKGTYFLQSELLAILLALSLAADGPLASDDLYALTGLDEATYRRLVTATSSIFKVWVAGRLRGARVAFTEGDIVRIGRAVAASKRDPLPRVIEHGFGTRGQANHVAGAGTGVFGDAPSYLVAIQGDFCASPARPRGCPPRESLVRYAVQVLILDAASGQIPDSGGGDTYPGSHAARPGDDRLRLPG